MARHILLQLVFVWAALVSSIVASQVLPFLQYGRLIPPRRSGSSERLAESSYHFFQQYIDHSNKSLGTFRQRYTFFDRYWKGPGSPIILTTPGETTIYIDNDDSSIMVQFAEAIGGALVSIEHRYYGESSPYKTLNAKTLQHMTLKNAIADMTNFANNVELPFAKGSSTKPSKVPWVFSGGSYAGALSAWIESTANGTFWAYHASSAVVEPIQDFWQYFGPTRDRAMPSHCARNVEDAIAYVDAVFDSGDASDIAKLKALFKMEGVRHAADFGSAISYYVYWQYGPNDKICHVLDQDPPTVNQSQFPSIPASPRVRKLVLNYAYDFRRLVCKGDNHGLENGWCYNSYNKHLSAYTDTGVSNKENRQWMWMLCNEPFAWWRTGGPQRQPFLMSKQVNVDYYQDICGFYFPTVDGFTFGSNKGKTQADIINYTRGWTRRPSKRLMWANFGNDPWRSATVSSDYRPGGRQRSTKDEPIFFIAEGYHCADFYTKEGNSTLAREANRAIKQEVAQMKKWVKEFH